MEVAAFFIQYYYGFSLKTFALSVALMTIAQVNMRAICWIFVLHSKDNIKAFEPINMLRYAKELIWDNILLLLNIYSKWKVIITGHGGLMTLSCGHVMSICWFRFLNVTVHQCSFSSMKYCTVWCNRTGIKNDNLSV